MSSEFYSDSDESGSASEELSDNGSYEDDGEDYASEGSDAEFDDDDDDDLEYASSGSSHETADSGDNDLIDNKVSFPAPKYETVHSISGVQTW